MAISKSSQAVVWMQNNPSATQAEAAELFGISASTLSHALAKRAAEKHCPCCGQTMKERKTPERQSKP